MANEDEISQSLLDALSSGQLRLPTPPDIALRVARTVADPDVTVARIAADVAGDPGLAARLVRVANSAAMRGRAPAQDLRSAITRLGLGLVSHLVTAMATEQLFRAKTPLVRDRMDQAWKRCVDVAAISEVLVAHHAKLPPEKAMLAGLLHGIGRLPILRWADGNPSRFPNAGVLDAVVSRLHPELGSAILEAWKFPPEIATVPRQHLQLDRVHAGPADYVDIVTVAFLQSVAGTAHPLAKADWSSVTAFRRLGLAPDAVVVELRDREQEIAEARSRLAE